MPACSSASRSCAAIPRCMRALLPAYRANCVTTAKTTELIRRPRRTPRPCRSRREGGDRMDGLAILLILVALYCAVSSLLGQRSITMPIVFVAIGLLFGARGLGVLALAPGAEVVKGVTEVTLALLLFADASTLKFGRVGAAAPLVARLLTIGLLLS